MPVSSPEQVARVIEEIVGATGSTSSLCEASLKSGEVITSNAVIAYQVELRDGNYAGCMSRGGTGLDDGVIGRIVDHVDGCLIHRWHADGHRDEVVTLSRIAETAEYRKSEHYEAVFGGSAGSEDILSIPVGSDQTLARVLLCRDGKEFTDDELDTARILQPVIAGCLRQSQVMEQMRSDPLSEEAMRERGLTAREAQIFCRLASGATSQAVGQELGISVRTVEKHVQYIYARIGARNRSEAISILLGKGASNAAAFLLTVAPAMALL
ncbi:MAG: response regulator transcription factor [Solirubrobacterales bacterium]